MSRLYLVRHGQASFFEDDYDKLSPLGERQSEVLGKYWAANAVRIDKVYCGTLRRQVQTVERIGATYAAGGCDWPAVETLPGLDEYPSEDIMGTLLPELCASGGRFQAMHEANQNAKERSDKYRAYHRLLEAVMEVWVSGIYESSGIPTWSEFSGGVRGALRVIMDNAVSGQTIAVSTSGGPIGVSVQTALAAPAIKAAELNWRIHNCSLTEFSFTKGRFTLDRFNSTAHLTDPEMLTYR